MGSAGAATERQWRAPALAAGCLLLPRAAVQDVGMLYTPWLFAGEEPLYASRLAAAGYRIFDSGCSAFCGHVYSNCTDVYRDRDRRVWAGAERTWVAHALLVVALDRLVRE